MKRFNRCIIRLLVRSMKKINGYLRLYITSNNITRSIFIGLSYNIDLLLNEILEELDNVTITDIKCLKRK